MKNKFIRVISPIALLVVIFLDIAVIYFGVFAVKKLIEFTTAFAIIFAIFELIAIVTAIFVTKDIVSHGVIFKEDELEFTILDDDNIFKYDDIVSVEIEKDEKASFIKNFVDRQSKVILTLADDKVVTIDIGLTTKKVLNDIEKEIKEKISN